MHILHTFNVFEANDLFIFQMRQSYKVRGMWFVFIVHGCTDFIFEHRVTEMNIAMQ